jgi:biotin carboxyl carrier protein
VIDAKVRRQPDGSLIADFGGAVHSIYAVEEPLGLRMVLDGTTVLLPTVYDPSELRTDVTGKIVRYLQDDGAEVQAGQPYVEVEAMKMIMPLKATESGALTRRMSPGSIITAGDLLATLALKDPSKVLARTHAPRPSPSFPARPSQAYCLLTALISPPPGVVCAHRSRRSCPSPASSTLARPPRRRPPPSRYAGCPWPHSTRQPLTQSSVLWLLLAVWSLRH